MGTRSGATGAAGWLLCAALVCAAPARGDEAPAPAPGTIEQLWTRGETAFEAGRLDEALHSFSAALSLDEQRARSWNYVGGVHFAQGDLTRALQDFRRALELDPLDVRAGNNLGTVLERLGDYEHAREAYQRTMLVDPAYPLTYRNLGILAARRLGDPEAARRAWQRYLELAPAGRHAEEIRLELERLPPPRSAQ